MEKIHEVLLANDDDTGPTYDTKRLEKDVEHHEDARVLLSSLIENLKLDIDENQKIHKQLKKANPSLAQELKDSKIELESFKNPEYLKKAQWGKPCLYNVKFDKHDLANLFAPESEEIIRLAKESRTKLNEMLKDLKYVQSLEKEVDYLKSQIETEKTKFSKSYDLLLQERHHKDFLCVILRSYDIDQFMDLVCLQIFVQELNASVSTNYPYLSLKSSLNHPYKVDENLWCFILGS
ncbi:hypothetical protein Tco_1159343 [Tanacetum coccineum]